MQVAEFDKFADEYAAMHKRNLAITGEDPAFFARDKIERLRRRWTRERRPEPASILDFGCGVGASLSHLAAMFPASQVEGIDVSERSLEVARSRTPDAVTLRLYDGKILPMPAASVDLIFSACVFHHIEPELRTPILANLRSLLRPGGALVLFEHNPVNPVTRYIVATCPFDENAVLLPARELVQRQKAAGFSRVSVTYTGFFPAALARLRPLEGALGAVPLGAQYYTLAQS